MEKKKMERAVFFCGRCREMIEDVKKKNAVAASSPSFLPHFSPMNVRKDSVFLAFGFLLLLFLRLFTFS